MAKYKLVKTARKYSKFLSLEEKTQEKRMRVPICACTKKIIFGNSTLVLSPEISRNDVVVCVSKPTGVVVKHSKTMEVVAHVLTKVPSKMINRLGYDLLE